VYLDGRRMERALLPSIVVGSGGRVSVSVDGPRKCAYARAVTLEEETVLREAPRRLYEQVAATRWLQSEVGDLERRRAFGDTTVAAALAAKRGALTEATAEVRRLLTTCRTDRDLEREALALLVDLRQ
jgi:hypothetical protein